MKTVNRQTKTSEWYRTIDALTYTPTNSSESSKHDGIKLLHKSDKNTSGQRTRVLMRSLNTCPNKLVTQKLYVGLVSVRHRELFTTSNCNGLCRIYQFNGHTYELVNE